MNQETCTYRRSSFFYLTRHLHDLIHYLHDLTHYLYNLIHYTYVRKKDYHCELEDES